MPHCSFSQKLAARLFSALIWNREARHEFRNALLCDYKAELKALREQLEALRAARPEMRVAAPPPMARAASPQNSYRIDGASNRIIVVESDGRERLLGKDERIPGLEISICGDDNEIRVHASCLFDCAKIQIGEFPTGKNNGARLDFCENAVLVGVTVRCTWGEQQVFRFGKNSRMWHCGQIVLEEKSGCIFGDDCNCSTDIRIWGSDGHAILDKNNPEKILNEVQGPITVGDHCWLGQAVRLQKNARIPANTIVAAAAVVTKAFDEEYTIIGGFPAKVIKRGVMREPSRLSAYHLMKKKAER